MDIVQFFSTMLNTWWTKLRYVAFSVSLNLNCFTKQYSCYIQETLNIVVNITKTGTFSSRLPLSPLYCSFTGQTCWEINVKLHRKLWILPWKSLSFWRNALEPLWWHAWILFNLQLKRFNWPDHCYHAVICLVIWRKEGKEMLVWSVGVTEKISSEESFCFIHHLALLSRTLFFFFSSGVATLSILEFGNCFAHPDATWAQTCSTKHMIAVYIQGVFMLICCTQRGKNWREFLIVKIQIICCLKQKPSTFRIKRLRAFFET